MILVGLYVLVAVGASVAFVRARAAPRPEAPDPWPPVVVQPSPQMVPHDAPGASSGRPPESVLDEVRLHTAPAPSDGAVDTLPEDAVLVTAPANNARTAAHLPSMVRACTAETPVVVGPTVLHHEDRFVARLHALQHLGRLAATPAALWMGISSVPDASNRAVHGGGRLNEIDAAALSPSAIATAPEAAVGRTPARSFGALVRRQAQWLRRTWDAGGLDRGAAAGLWGLHTLLLACGLVAVAVPAWRQPTLLALLGKMGADGGLALPAAKHYGQRGLLRSIVPAELVLVLALPMAGLRALFGPIHESAPASSPETHRAERS